MFDVTDGRQIIAARLPREYGRCWGLAVSPDGRFAACGGEKTGVIAVWNTENGEIVHELSGHAADAMIFDLAFTPDGRFLVSSSKDGTVRVWRLPREAWPAGTSTSLPSTAVADPFSQPGPAEDVLLGLVPRPAKLPGVKRWQVQTRAPRSHLAAVDWSPNGKQIACSGYDPVVRIYDAETGQIQRLLHGHTRLVEAIAWSPDGKHLASASFDGTLQIWHSDGRTGPVVNAHNGTVRAVAWYREIAPVTFDSGPTTNQGRSCRLIRDMSWTWRGVPTAANWHRRERIAL